MSRDWRTSGWKSHDAFEALIGVIRASEKIVQCGLVLRSADKSQMCCDIRSAFSVLNQTTKQPVLVKDGTDSLDSFRQLNCNMFHSDLLDKHICVNDVVIFEVEWTLSIASVSYGDPIGAPLRAAPVTSTAEFFHKKSLSDVTFLVGPDEWKSLLTEQFWPSGVRSSIPCSMVLCLKSLRSSKSRTST